MRTLRSFALLSCLLVGFAAMRPGGGDNDRIASWKTMVGTPRAFTGATAPIRGVNGGGLPWVVDEGVGRVRADGEVDIKVKGLVLDPNDPDVINAGLAGVNPAPFFKAIISCLTVDESGRSVVRNVETRQFEADADGDCVIKDRVELPEPCIAPIVFVTNANGSWFAVTGL